MSLSLDSFVKTHELLRATNKVAPFTTSALKGVSGKSMLESLRTIGSVKLLEGLGIGSVATGCIFLTAAKIKELRAARKFSESFRDRSLTVESSFAEIIEPDKVNVDTREEGK